MPDQVFFSWQSDLPNRTNRTIIGEALERAVLQLSLDPSVAVVPVVDRDTLGEPGSPDIVATILRKIDMASAFVADVTLVTKAEAGRPSPNPNVLLELGYALHALGPERIVMVLNSAFGGVDLLPFDLRFKRALIYTLGPEEPPGNARAMLGRALEQALRAVFTHIHESSFEEQANAFTTALASELATVLIFLDELPERQLNPWYERATVTLESVATELRRLATTAEAERIAISSELDNLADSLIDVARRHRHFGDGDEIQERAQRAAVQARAIKAQRVDLATITPESLRKAGAALRDLARTLRSIARRARRTIDQKLYQDFAGLLEEAAGVGFIVLKFLQFEIGAMAPASVASLRTIARDLHLVEVNETSEVNWSRRERTLERLAEMCNEAASILADPNLLTRA